MKRYIYLLIGLFLSLNSFTQAPNLFNYQAVIRDSNGQGISNTEIQVRISILIANANGELVYQELHQVLTNDNGLITLKIGGGYVLNGTMDAIKWQFNEYYLKTEVDETNTNQFTEISTTQLLSVPYAKTASVANSIILTSPDGQKHELKVDNSGWVYSEEVDEWECGEPFIDIRNGQPYGTTLIGSECWMTKNMDIGEMIPHTEDMQNNNQIEKYCYDNSPANCDTYGALYQWDEIMQYQIIEGTTGICPVGWHIPTDMEWYNLVSFVDTTIHDTIEDYLGITAGGDLKSTLFWNAPNTGAIDKYGFSALPSGFVFIDAFNSINESTFFSTSSSYTSGSSTFFYSYSFDYNSAKVNRDSYYQMPGLSIYGQSVRCTKHVDLIYIGCEWDNNYPYADQAGALHAFHDSTKNEVPHNGFSPSPLTVHYGGIYIPNALGFSWLLVPSSFDPYLYAAEWGILNIEENWFSGVVNIYGTPYQFYKMKGALQIDGTYTGRIQGTVTFYTQFQ